jgi:hypothetical protein
MHVQTHYIISHELYMYIQTHYIISHELYMYVPVCCGLELRNWNVDHWVLHECLAQFSITIVHKGSLKQYSFLSNWQPSDERIYDSSCSKTSTFYSQIQWVVCYM